MTTTSEVSSMGKRVASTGTRTAAVDFRSGEVLCGTREDAAAVEDSYRAAKILTSPSAATQHQAEVLFADGDRQWVSNVLQTHVPANAELTVGDWILYMPHYSDDEEVPEKTYRTSPWRFGRVTSIDELFKDVVEIDGRPCHVKWTRLPDTPVS